MNGRELTNACVDARERARQYDQGLRNYIAGAIMSARRDIRVGMCTSAGYAWCGGIYVATGTAICGTCADDLRGETRQIDAQVKASARGEVCNAF